MKPTRRRHRRRWEDSAEDDPAAGLLNLFDLWMVFAVALLLTVATLTGGASAARSRGANEKAGEGETLSTQSTRLDRLQASDHKLGGEGQRLGTAYRLKSGEVVYVPDDKVSPSVLRSDRPHAKRAETD